MRNLKAASSFTDGLGKYAYGVKSENTFTTVILDADRRAEPTAKSKVASYIPARLLTTREWRRKGDAVRFHEAYRTVQPRETNCVLNAIGLDHNSAAIKRALRALQGAAFLPEWWCLVRQPTGCHGWRVSRAALAADQAGTVATAFRPELIEGDLPRRSIHVYRRTQAWIR